jgi:DMSO/TMAO reductase YedYZ molybdopterin-dependent catalytic subunit
MDRPDPLLATETSRRRLLAMGAIAAAAPALGQSVDLRLAGGGGMRAMSDAFPGKRGMILQRTRPPLLETPMSVFDAHDLTPNDRFFVRWHYDDIPTAVDVRSFRLRVGGHVARPVAFGLEQLLRLPRIDYVAVNQCSGNSRGWK